MTRFQVGLAALLSSVALAAEQPQKGEAASGGQMTSVLSGKSLGSGMVVHGQVGWPGLSVSLLAGTGGPLDLGGRFSVVYAYEGITQTAGVPGLKLQGVLRLQLLDRGRFNLGLRFSPGVFFAFFPGDLEIGMPLPVDLALGIAVTPKLMINLGVDVPAFVAFGPYGGLAVPLLLGGGVEFAIDRQLAITVNLRAGPSVPLTGNGYVSPNWPGSWCLDPITGRLYQCGPYYSSRIVALEGLFGLTYRL